MFAVHGTIYLLRPGEAMYLVKEDYGSAKIVKLRSCTRV